MKAYALAGVTIALALTVTPAGAASVDRVFAFGDSLNDCCRNPAAPFTNGPETWLPAFASAIGASYSEDPAYNFAVGGAQTGPVNAVAQTDIDLGEPTGFTSQAARFRDAAPATGAQDLGVIWVSTNDIWATAHDGDLLFGAVPFNRPVGRRPGTSVLVDHIVDSLRTGIADLVDGGIEKLLILTPYDMGDSGLWDTPEAKALNTVYSLAIRDALLSLGTPGVETWVLDMVSVLSTAQEGFAFKTAAQSCQAAGDGINCDDHAFYDFVHLTTSMNAIVSAEAAKLVQAGAPVAPVPLPASAILLMSGFACLGAVRRRRLTRHVRSA